jgi:hypothetical protein
MADLRARIKGQGGPAAARRAPDARPTAPIGTAPKAAGRRARHGTALACRDALL